MLSKLRDEGYETIMYTFAPGTAFGDHSHSVAKKDSILSGRFLFRMHGQEVRKSSMHALPHVRHCAHLA